MLKRFSKPVIWLVTLMLVALLSSFFASTVQNSFFSVKVDKVSFETERGELSGYLFIPKGVSDTNPAPAVVLTHGYLNNAEMQEIGAIELSRRGYVVLAFDMYDHGDSTWDTPAAFSFFPRAVYDAVQYMYDQDYVLKAANGDGMIGISGHSMGGFSSSYAVIFDEMDFVTNGYRKIAAALPVGADFRYIGVANPETYFGPRSAGIVAAHWDQFFFDNVTPAADGSVRYKDFANDPVGLKFLGRDDEGTAEASTWYQRDGGTRIIYTPDETHPQNTWSLETGKNTIEFFEAAFEYQLGLHADLGDLESYDIDINKNGQVWWLKEAFTMVALVALFLMIFPAFMILTKFPVFNKVFGEKKETKAVNADKTQLGLKIVITLLATVIGAYYLNIFMDRQVAGMAILAKTMHYIIGGVFVLIIGAWLGSMINPSERMTKVAQKVTLGGGIVVFLALAYRWVLNNPTIISRSTYWSAPSVNTIAYWALAAAFLILLITVGTAPLFNKDEDDNQYGITASWHQVGASLLTAVTLTFGLFLFIGIVEWIFLTDFRFYTYAIKIFNSQQFVAALRYMPIFFIYYLAAAISVFVNTKRMDGWKADIFAAFLLVGPVLFFLAYQYFVLYNTGVAPFPTFNLSSILLIGLVPTLSVAGIIMRRFSLKTGNVWTSVFFTTMFFTFVAVANTVVYLISFK